MTESCVACRSTPRTRGLLCESCADGLVADDVCPEQIAARVSAPVPGHVNAWLIDGFGVPHTVSVSGRAPLPWAAVTLGRDRKSDVCVAERTVSLVHAALEYRALSNAWFVVDAGSDNGTWVDEDRVPRRFPLEPRDRLFLGRRVGFLFVPLDDADLDDAARELSWLRARAPSEPTFGDAGVDTETPLKISAAREGGAVAVWGSERVQLSELEYELLTVLHRRWSEETTQDDVTRGFVPAAHLLDALSFQSEAPTHANLRGLVRKLRRKFADARIALDVVESRKGLGYRLARRLLFS
jgi:pSer/pThr/pTyr-binding forkhead associated (FHA) protein